MSHQQKIVNWKGPKGWSGEAVPNYKRFPFVDLPWPWIKHEDEIDRGALCVKSSNSRRVYRVDLAEFSKGKYAGVAYAKRYLANNWRRRIGVRLTGTKASHEFRLGHELLARGLPTPRPLAWAAHLGSFHLEVRNRHVVMPPASYLLTLEWPNEGSIRDWLKQHPGAQADLTLPLARFLAETHRVGFYHDDCSSEHILVRRASLAGRPAAEFEFCFIDVDNGRLAASPLPRRQRVTNLFQILRSLPLTRLPRRQRIIFLEAYLAHSADVYEDRLDTLIDSIEKLAERKVGRAIVRP